MNEFNVIFDDEQSFHIGSSDLSFCLGKPFRFNGGGLILCTCGNAVVSVDFKEYEISKDREVVLFTKPAFMLKSASRDFRARVLVCSDSVLHIVCHKLGSAFFERTVSKPVFHHTAESLELTSSYLDLMEDTNNDTGNGFRTIIMSNLLRCLLLNISDRIRRDEGPSVQKPPRGRYGQLFDSFMECVSKHALHHRNVSYYAGRLCVSERYLSRICRSIEGRSPKEIIDEKVVGEIKILLMYSEMTLSQISDTMLFPDQSYFGRYFKAKTGCSPVSFRNCSLSPIQGRDM